MEELSEQDANPSGLVAYLLPPEIVLAVGHITLAVARLDDDLSRVIFKLGGLSQQDGAIIVGRQNLSLKIRTVDLFFKAHPERKVSEWDSIKPALQDIIKVRNLLAHGIYVGKETAGGRIVFTMRADIDDPVDGVHAAKAVGISEKYLLDLVGMLPGALKAFREVFDLTNTPVGELRPRAHKGREAKKKKARADRPSPTKRPE